MLIKAEIGPPSVLRWLRKLNFIQDFDRECQHHYATCEIHVLRFVQSLIKNIQHGAVNSPLSPAVMKDVSLNSEDFFIAVTYLFCVEFQSLYIPDGGLDRRLARAGVPNRVATPPLFTLKMLCVRY